jgi:spore coat polysaccharide biosynthesis protein SpsF
MGEMAGGRSMLEHLYTRVSASKRLSELVVCTSTSALDDPLADAARRRGWPVWRGSENDVLDRMYGGAKSAQADIVVRISGDCILHDARIVDYVVDHYLAQGNVRSFVCNKRPFTWPDGFDVEVCSMSMFEEVWRDARTAFEREHVFPLVYRYPERFGMHNVVRPDGPELFHLYRIVLDYHEDLALIRTLIEQLGADASFEQIMMHLETHPELHAPVNQYLPPAELCDAWQFEIAAMNAAKAGTSSK